MSSTVVALCGRRCVGKDEVAKYLVNHYGFIHLKISSSLKNVCGSIFGFTPNQLEKDKDLIDPRLGVTPRFLMQRFGTDVTQRIISELPNDRIASSPDNFWMKSMIKRHFADVVDDNIRKQNIVISDVRFPSECEELRLMHRALIVKLHRTRRDIENFDGLDVDEHLSESQSNSIEADIVINNESSVLDDLYKQVDDVIAPLINGCS